MGTLHQHQKSRADLLFDLPEKGAGDVAWPISMSVKLPGCESTCPPSIIQFVLTDLQETYRQAGAGTAHEASGCGSLPD